MRGCQAWGKTVSDDGDVNEKKGEGKKGTKQSRVVMVVVEFVVRIFVVENKSARPLIFSAMDAKKVYLQFFERYHVNCTYMCDQLWTSFWAAKWHLWLTVVNQSTFQRQYQSAISSIPQRILHLSSSNNCNCVSPSKTIYLDVWNVYDLFHSSWKKIKVSVSLLW